MAHHARWMPDQMRMFTRGQGKTIGWRPLRLAASLLLTMACSRSTQSQRETVPVPGADHLYYVSASGDDSTGAPDDRARAYRSPSGAFAAMPADIGQGPGDHIIEVIDGAVYGQLALTSRGANARNRIILRASPGATPTLDAHSRADGSAGADGGMPALLILTDHAVIQGFRFANTNIDPNLGPGGGSHVMVRLEGSHVVIDGNYFDGSGRTPTTTDMFLLVCNTASDNLISGNRFDFSGGKSLLHVTASCGGGSPSRLTIRNNVFSRFGNNPQAICAAINFGGQRGTLAGNNSVVENNTIHDNGGGCYGLLNTNTSALVVRNNIVTRITGHRYAIGCNAATGTSAGTAHNSLMFGNTRDVEPCWSVSGLHNEDPYFADPAASPPDLHLQSTVGSRRNASAAWFIDAHCSGAIDRAAPTDAFGREPSPNGGRRNLGAYGNTAEASKSCTP